MDAALQVFAERGVLGASVEEISERAGFTRGAFYSNFGSKDDLVLALLDREAGIQIGHAREAIATVLTDTLPTEEAANTQISRTVEVFFAAQRADRDWVVAQRELRLHAIRTAAIADDFTAFDDRWRGELVGLLGDAVARAGREFSVPIDEALALLVAVYEHAVLADLTARSGHTPTGRAPRELMTTLLTAITRPVGGRSTR